MTSANDDSQFMKWTAPERTCCKCGKSIGLGESCIRVPNSMDLECLMCHTTEHTHYNVVPSTEPIPKETMTTFSSGATRSSDEDKLDFEGFLHPAVLQRYCQYLHKHRRQADGKMRDSDNWQKGMPIWRYVKSLIRHVKDVWLHHRGQGHLAEYDDEEDCICGVLFNAQGLLLEKLIQRGEVKRDA